MIIIYICGVRVCVCKWRTDNRTCTVRAPGQDHDGYATKRREAEEARAITA